MHFLLQFPSLLHSLIQCIFFSVFHPSFTFPKHCWYHLDRIVWGFLSLTPPFFSFCLLDCVFLSASRYNAWCDGKVLANPWQLHCQHFFLLCLYCYHLSFLSRLILLFSFLLPFSMGICVFFFIKYRQGSGMLHSLTCTEVWQNAFVFSSVTYILLESI